jgi:hypothetical protein
LTFYFNVHTSNLIVVGKCQKMLEKTKEGISKAVNPGKGT